MRLPPGGGSSAGDRGVGGRGAGRSVGAVPAPRHATLLPHPSPVTPRIVPHAPQLPGTVSTVDQAAGWRAEAQRPIIMRASAYATWGYDRIPPDALGSRRIDARRA